MRCRYESVKDDSARPGDVAAFGRELTAANPRFADAGEFLRCIGLAERQEKRAG
jgi:hypothetical protein